MRSKELMWFFKVLHSKYVRGKSFKIEGEGEEMKIIRGKKVEYTVKEYEDDLLIFNNMKTYEIQ